MKTIRACLSALLALFSCIPLLGAHIAGSELTYECLGHDTYRIQLTLYRDCAGYGAGFDEPLTIFIFQGGGGTLYQTVDLAAPISTPTIGPGNWSSCTSDPYTLCLEKGVYETTVILPAQSLGYDIAWTRCCRNGGVTNLFNSDCQGATFLASVPPEALATCNSMPIFNQTPSLFLCAGEPFYFDYSATDPDGDSLAYEITVPYGGENIFGIGSGSPLCGSPNGPVVDPVNQPMGGPPYVNVNYAPGITGAPPFGTNGSISINSQTGFLTALPPNPGLYVGGVSVKEYRNGAQLSENKRDFQFYVINCTPGPASEC